MPILEAAKKALRQNKKHKVTNLEYKNKVKSLVKKALILVSENKPDELKQIIPSLYKAVDKAVKIGLLQKNTAARKKSRIAKKLALLTTPRK